MQCSSFFVLFFRCFDLCIWNSYITYTHVLYDKHLHNTCACKNIWKLLPPSPHSIWIHTRCYPNGKLICRSAYIPVGSVEKHENCRNFVLHFLLTRERGLCVSLQHRLQTVVSRNCNFIIPIFTQHNVLLWIWNKVYI